MLKRIGTYIFLVLACSMFGAGVKPCNAQVIFQETFDEANGSTTGIDSGVPWTTACPTCLAGDYLEVQGGVLEANDTNGEAEWTTDTPIDISNCDYIEISFDVTSVGTMEACGTGCNSADWVSFQYDIDGSGWTDPGNSYFCSGGCAGLNVIADDETAVTYSTGCMTVTGNDLLLRIAMQCWAGSEYWQIDNITVTCISTDPGTNGTINLCSGDPAVDLFGSLGGTPDGGGTWSPALASGTGVFDPSVDPAGTYTYTVGSGTCPTQSADVVVTVNTCCTNMDSLDYDSFEYSGTIPDLVPGSCYHNTPQNWAVRTGATSVYMNFQNGFQGVAYDRTYNVCPNQTYQLSAWFSNTWGGVPDVDLRLTVYDGTGVILHQTTSLVVGGPWVQYNTGQIIPTTTTIRFEVYTNIAGGVGNNDCSMDDVLLERCAMPTNNANAGAYCSSDVPLDLYNSIQSPLSNGGAWSGPSVLAGGYLGTFDPSTNASGTYTYTIPGVGACPDSIATVDITVATGPQLDPLLDVTVCDSYTLLPITGTGLSGNEAYYDAIGGTGTQYLPGQVLNATTTLYAYDATTGPPVCSDEQTFTVNIANADVDLGNDTTICLGESITFDAGAGFDTYLWQDGSTNQTYTASAAGTYWCEVGVLGTNQVQNGDFEMGDNFFNSGYTNGTGGAWGPLSNPGTYEVLNNPQLGHTNFSACTDHTSGAGQMMVVNGSSVAGTNVWCQTISVTPGTDYMFSTWVANAINDPNVAQLQFSIDGAALGPVFSTSPTACLWQEFSATWNSGAATSVTICVTNQNVATGGNDFLMDDVYFAPICLDRDSVEVFIQNPPTAGTDGAINFCPGDAAADLFNSLGSTPDVGGTWAPVMASGTGLFDPNVDPAGVYDYTVSGGGVCPDSTASVTVSVGGVSDATITIPPNFCEVDAAYGLTAASGGGAWAGVGITDPTLGTFDPGVAGAGAHEITYTIAGGCGDADTVMITVDTPVNAGHDSALVICINDPAIDLLTLVSPADAGGVWLPAMASGTGVLDPSVDPGAVYQYVVSGPGACPNDTANVDVTINSLADATISSAGPYCENEAPTNLAAATIGGTWSGTGITDAALGTFDPAVAGVGTHTITYNITGSCGATDTEDITVNAIVDPTVNPQADICESAGLITLSAINPGGTWDGDGITNVATGEFDPSLFGPGTYTLTYTITGVCPSSDDVTFNVLADQIPTITPPSEWCADGPADFLQADLPGGDWSGNGIANPTFGLFDPAVAGVGTHEIIYTISSMCGGADTIIVVVNELPSVVTSISDSLGCPVLEVLADYSSDSTAVDCLWSLSDGTQMNACGPQTFAFSSAGCYDLSLTVTDINGCTQSVIHPNQICVVESPLAAFNASPEHTTELEPQVDFTNMSSDAVSYVWSVENTTYNTADVVHSFTEPGYFNVCLEAYNTIGCADTTCKLVVVDSLQTIYVPNSFTPDGDGKNDLFYPSIYGFTPVEYEFMIFNRWGELIWSSDVPGQGWDGSTFAGSLQYPAQEDVYVWKLIYRQPDSIEIKNMVGHVTVIR